MRTFNNWLFFIIFKQIKDTRDHVFYLVQHVDKLKYC